MLQLVPIEDILVLIIIKTRFPTILIELRHYICAKKRIGTVGR
jgi:hypothetical protein